MLPTHAVRLPATVATESTDVLKGAGNRANLGRCDVRATKGLYGLLTKIERRQ